MKLDINRSELTQCPTNPGDILELADADLLQVQGGWGNNCDNRESYTNDEYCGGSNGYNSQSFHHHRRWHSHHQNWNSNDGYNSWGSSNDYNNWGSSNGCNNRGAYNGCSNY